MSAVSLFNDFDVSEINVGKVMKNKHNGGQTVPLTKLNNAKIYIQTPSMFVPFGISEFAGDAKPDGSQNIRYSLDLSFRNYLENSEIASMKSLIESLDKFMIDLGMHHSIAWFGNQKSKDVIEELYRPLMRPSKDPEKYAPTFKLKFRSHFQSNQIQAKAFDVEKQEMNVTNIPKGCKMKVIFEVSPIWFVGKQFGISLNIAQVMLTENPVYDSFATNMMFPDDDANSNQSNIDMFFDKVF